MSQIDRQHASRALQSDGWNRFVAGRASCSVDDQVGDATCGQEVGWVIRWCWAEEPCLPVCCRQVEPHAQIPRCVDRIRRWDSEVRPVRWSSSSFRTRSYHRIPFLQSQKMISYNLRNSDNSYVLPQCKLNVFKRSFINWRVFTL